MGVDYFMLLDASEKIEQLKDKLQIQNTVTFGTIEGKYTHTINPGEFNRVVKIMKREAK